MSVSLVVRSMKRSTLAVALRFGDRNDICSIVIAPRGGRQHFGHGATRRDIDCGGGFRSVVEAYERGAEHFCIDREGRCAEYR